MCFCVFWFIIGLRMTHCVFCVFVFFIFGHKFCIAACVLRVFVFSWPFCPQLLSLPCYLHLFSLFVVVSSIGEFTLLVPSPLFFMCFCVFPVRNNFVGQKLIRSFLRCHERRLRPFFDMSHDVYSLWCFTKTYF